MNRLTGPLLSLVFLPAAWILAGCAASRPLTPVSAAALAARLANDRCHRIYGAHPFSPEAFDAVLDRERWHWGTVNAGKIDGYEVDVTFAADGSHPRVRVVIPPE